ncbi:hypothetical protein [Rheinheimera sp. 4Y26]|uniref:hypothetical protein n=1 Tax=Rheinheimera sp. 4Y26 TaxID=2977811 RepID=UPI0021B0D84D|nr:hypothetical protein [Rheinheimera sp. 4Y26]MCT6701443.1 hypothetical protein [Rheinheimera sp. 4Y26]
MRVFRDSVLTAFVIVFLYYSPVTQAGSDKDWPVWDGWDRTAQRSCNKKSNTGKDQVLHRNCMTESLLRDFPLPAGLAEACKAQFPQSSTTKEQAKQLHKCVADLIVNNANNKDKVARAVKVQPETLKPVLKQCEEAYTSSGVAFAQKWQHIYDCVRKSQNVNR